jgi:hypothetical protein
MLLKKKRIRSVKANAPFLKDGKQYMVGVELNSIPSKKLEKLGLADPQPGDSILPSGIGPVSRFNADGKSIPNKELPMETAYTQIEWCWNQWAGRGETEEVCKIVDRPYKRYPRTFIEPPSIELSVFSDASGQRFIVSPVMEYADGDDKEFVHTINLFLEIFGECAFFDDSLSQIIKVPVKKLNWKLLPEGERPWKSLKEELEPVIKQITKGKRSVIEYRLETINKHSPSFAAVGTGGFNGYIVLGFPKRNLYVLESLLYGNATYVFGSDWKKLSQLTKKEILNESLQQDRLIHRNSWHDQVDKVLELTKKK